MESFWRKCSTCKKPIGFGQTYQRCNVSTCNQVRVSLVFCTVSCWSAHVPVYRHRDAWALEETAPSAQEAAAQASTADPVPAKILVRPPSSASTPSVPMAASVPGLAAAPTDDVLVVVSKLKAYIKARADMNTSGDVSDALSDKIRKLCDLAIQEARADGRKTVMARDFKV